MAATDLARSIAQVLLGLREAIQYRYLPESVEITADERTRLIGIFNADMHFPIEPGVGESIFGLAIVLCEDPTQPDLPETRAFHAALAAAYT